MKEPDKGRITGLLKRVNEGDVDAWTELYTIIYQELHRIAKSNIEKGRPENIFQTTQLVNEAYLRLVQKTNQNWENRKHFFNMASKVMHNFLKETYRKLKAQIRGGQHQRVPLEDGLITCEKELSKLIDLGDALEKLYETERSWGEVANLHLYNKLTQEETAKILGISLKTVERHCAIAKAFLKRELKAYSPFNRDKDKKI